MANPHKNEYEVDFGDQKLTLRATFDCLSNIEETLDKSFIELSDLVASGKIRFHQVLIILNEGLQASGSDLTPDQVKDLVMSVGLVPIVLQLQSFMLAAVSGGEALNDILENAPIDEEESNVARRTIKKKSITKST